MDVHEAPAFQNAGLSDADQAYADRLSGQAAAAAAATDADSDLGVMDGSGAAGSGSDSDSSDLKGPTPR